MRSSAQHFLARFLRDGYESGCANDPGQASRSSLGGVRPLVLVVATLFFACGLVFGQDYKLGEKIRPVAPAKTQPPSVPGAPRTIKWEDLIPAGWDPLAALRGLDLARLDDADPRAQKILDEIKKAWDKAPPNRQLHGQRIRIPGFVVSLEGGPNEVREFLLVPYFGACIHVPPPPANQVIHAVAKKPVKIRTMDAVWATGRLEVVRSDTPFGAATYVMQVEHVAPYNER